MYSMKYIILTFLCFTTISILCQNNTFKKSDIYGCWTDSFEEYNNDSKFKVFRPCNYNKIPPARFRYKFEIKNNGEFHWLELAKNDRHYKKKGTWIYNSKSKTLSIFNDKKNKVEDLVIMKIIKDKLTIKKH